MRPKNIINKIDNKRARNENNGKHSTINKKRRKADSKTYNGLNLLADNIGNNVENIDSTTNNYREIKVNDYLVLSTNDIEKILNSEANNINIKYFDFSAATSKLNSITYEINQAYNKLFVFFDKLAIEESQKNIIKITLESICRYDESIAFKRDCLKSKFEYLYIRKDDYALATTIKGIYNDNSQQHIEAVTSEAAYNEMLSKKFTFFAEDLINYKKSYQGLLLARADYLENIFISLSSPLHAIRRKKDVFLNTTINIIADTDGEKRTFALTNTKICDLAQPGRRIKVSQDHPYYALACKGSGSSKTAKTCYLISKEKTEEYVRLNINNVDLGELYKLIAEADYANRYAEPLIFGNIFNKKRNSSLDLYTRAGMCDLHTFKYSYSLINESIESDNGLPTILLQCLEQILKILHKMHNDNIIHNDVKMENIIVYLIDKNTNQYAFKLSDYGACCVEGSTTGPRACIVYAAPEIFKLTDNATYREYYNYYHVIDQKNIPYGKILSYLYPANDSAATFKTTDKKDDVFALGLSILKTLMIPPVSNFTQKEGLAHWYSYTCDIFDKYPLIEILLAPHRHQRPSANEAIEYLNIQNIINKIINKTEIIGNEINTLTRFINEEAISHSIPARLRFYKYVLEVTQNHAIISIDTKLLNDRIKELIDLIQTKKNNDITKFNELNDNSTSNIVSRSQQRSFGY